MKEQTYQVARWQKIAGILTESIEELDYRGGLKDPYGDATEPTQDEMDWVDAVIKILQQKLGRELNWKDHSSITTHSKSWGLPKAYQRGESPEEAADSILSNYFRKELDEEDTSYDTDWQGAYDEHVKTAVEAVKQALSLGQGEITQDSVLSDVKKMLDLESAEYDDSDLPFNETELPSQRIRSAGELTVDKFPRLHSALIWGLKNATSEAHLINLMKRAIETGGSQGFGSSKKTVPLPLNDQQKESVLQYAAEEFRNRKRTSSVAPKD